MAFKIKGVFPKGVDGASSVQAAVNSVRDRAHALEYSTRGYALRSCSKRRKKPIATWPDLATSGGSITADAECPDCKAILEVWL